MKLKFIKRKSLTIQVFLILIVSLLFPVSVLTLNVMQPGIRQMTDVEDKRNRMQELADDLHFRMDNNHIGKLIKEKVAVGDINELQKALGEETKSYLSGSSNYQISYHILSINKVILFSNLSKESLKSSIKDYKDGPMGRANDINEITPESLEIIEAHNKNMIRKSIPIEYNGELIAVSQIQEMVPPFYFPGRNLRRYVTLSLFIGFLAGAGGIILIYSSIIKKINTIKSGLRNMENDVNNSIPEINGELGEIVTAINKMGKAVAEKEQLEEQLARSEKLSALGHLVSGVAHEMRNPLGIIRGTVQLMESEYKDIKGMGEYIEVLKEQSERQNHVIEELLDFARPSKEYIQKLNVNNLIQSVLTFTRSHMKHNKIVCEEQLNDNIPWIEGDGEKIKQVFVNIILNACDAMKDGGKLVIKTCEKEGFVHIAFEDNGEGIAESEIKDIFNPFFTTRTSGTGLGLAISHRIVDFHKGFIDVKSQVGKGSIFTIKLPIVID